jgi:hypothetical protein
MIHPNDINFIGYARVSSPALEDSNVAFIGGVYLCANRLSKAFRNTRVYFGLNLSVDYCGSADLLLIQRIFHSHLRSLRYVQISQRDSDFAPWNGRAFSPVDDSRQMGIPPVRCDWCIHCFYSPAVRIERYFCGTLEIQNYQHYSGRVKGRKQETTEDFRLKRSNERVMIESLNR